MKTPAMGKLAKAQAYVAVELYEAMRRKSFIERVSNRQIIEAALRAYLANYLVTEEAGEPAKT